MLGKDKLTAHPDLWGILKRQALSFLAIRRDAPRLAAPFGTQQRYLLSQLGVAMAYESETGGFLLTHYLDAVQKHGIASRNTAESFLREMLHYGVISLGEPRKDRRTRPLVVGQEALNAIRLWLIVHLNTLDEFDDGTRVARFEAQPGLISRLHPAIVKRVLVTKTTTEPSGTFALFTWMNDGGILMDKMVANLGDHSGDAERLRTAISSFEELSELLRITRAHLSRKLAISEKEGHLGWEGKRGGSVLWISREFYGEYVTYQTDKLAEIDIAFHDTVA